MSIGTWLQAWHSDAHAHAHAHVQVQVRDVMREGGRAGLAPYTAREQCLRCNTLLRWLQT